MVKIWRVVSVAFALWLAVSQAEAQPSHCLSLYEPCKYKAGFTHFDYVNPNAPKRGTLKLAEMGTFDSVHAPILKGVKAPGLSYVHETLMTRSEDEPQSYYGLIADTVDIAGDKKSVTFTINKKARWHDGTPITAQDVVFSFNTLKSQGDPIYALIYADVTHAEARSDRAVTFYFTTNDNRELPFMVASLPVYPEHDWKGRAFDASTLEPRLGSGPYRIKAIDAGRSITYERVPNYWGADIPANRGQYNVDEIRFDLYRDEGVSLEAFKAGEYHFRREYVARNWARGYDTPAVKDGRIIKRELEHAIPQGMQAFVMNTRKPQFADRRVREAVALAMDFEWMNKTLFFDAYLRNTSFFQATPFAASDLPSKDELAILAPWKDSLPERLFTERFVMPSTDGSGNDRKNLLRAQALLNDAGYKVINGKRALPNGKPFTIEFMLRQPTMERVVGAMRKNLERLGITTIIRRVDDAQYQKRTDSFDFDVVSVWVNQGVFYPGNEQRSLWHSAQAATRGSNALSGLKSPAVDAALDALTRATDLKSLIAAGRALDRVLLWEWVVIPNWHSQSFRLAYWNVFGIPANPPRYGIGFNAWWMKDAP